MQSSSRLPFQRSFDVLRRSQVALAPFRDPAALLDGLHRPSGDPEARNCILRALVAAAQGDDMAVSDCALTLLLLALWPGLDALRHRSLRRRLGTADEIASDLLARSTEAIRRLELVRVNWIAATVLRNVERDMIRARQRDALRERLTHPAHPDELCGAGAGRQPVPEDAHLQHDLRKLLGNDARLVIRVAIEGTPQGEVAGELRLSAAATRKRYQRALRRLRDVFAAIP